MSSATTSLKGMFGRVGQLFRKPELQKHANTGRKVLMRPTVPPTTRWTTGQISVTPEDGQRRLTDMLCRQYDVSRAFVHRLLREGKVTVMRARPVEALPGTDVGIADPAMVKTWAPRENMRVIAGDLITMAEVILPPRTNIVLPKSNVLTEKTIEYMRSLVIHKDDRLIVINKPAGLAVHSGPGSATHIEGWLGALQYDAEIAPLLVHRLDKGTSGVLLLARTRDVAADLAARFRESHLDASVEKVYWALVRGMPDKRNMEGEIVTNIYRTAKTPNERMTSFADRRSDLLDEGKVAITRYRWMQLHLRRSPREKLSLIELQPLTGRTHQLRVHMAEQLKLPIFGDYRYFRNQLPNLKLHLHCYRITLKNWNDGKPLTIKASIPRHFIETMHDHPLKLNTVPKHALKRRAK
ncbi:Pseudouridine synthase [Paramicrosporidium saccamoebae]|uniref:Pseudouridine synthase n=1 Tax=Paramicrosporidium saccamoebae TaxID=1246581 RepID=A0A2H9TMU3_9FUNG|nr:Pseudouridine synthase [Paramicrosporidium saccamoebae]